MQAGQAEATAETETEGETPRQTEGERGERCPRLAQAPGRVVGGAGTLRKQGGVAWTPRAGEGRE